MKRRILRGVLGGLMGLAGAAGGVAEEPPGILHFQGRLVVEGVNFDGTGGFKFALVDGGRLITKEPDPPVWVYRSYWSHDGTSAEGGPPDSTLRLEVTDGLYDVLLGDSAVPGMTEPIPASVFDRAAVYLRVWFDDGKNGMQQLVPDQRVSPVGYAMRAAGVQAGGVTTAMLDEAAVTTAQIADAAVTAEKIADGAIDPSHLDRTAEEAFAAFLDAVEALGGERSLPREALTPVVATGGLEPTFTFLLDGVAFGTVVGFVSWEGISEPSHTVVEISVPSAPADPVAWLGLEGRLIFVRNGRFTTFGGIVTGVHRSSADTTTLRYGLRLESPLVRLQRTSDYRIRQELTVPELFDMVYAAGVGASYNDALTGSYPTQESFVQYRETDFAFLSRRLQEAGIFYFFAPNLDPGLLVLGDAPASYREAPNDPFAYYGNTVAPPVAGTEYIQHFRTSTRASIRRSTAGGYDFQNPLVDLDVSATGTGAEGETFTYETTSFAESTSLAPLLQERVEVERNTSGGSANAPDLRPGHTFTLNDLSGAGVGGDYLVIRVAHVGFNRVVAGASGLAYANRFEVIPASQPFRPPRKTPRPVIHGPSTAVVTGPAGEEIYTDEYGRVKVQFHWDRSGSGDEHSSGWIRVASPVAGGADRHGMFFLPRVGDEVLVEFAEGDPDRPVIIGSLYNGVDRPPVSLPDNKWTSTLRTRSPTGGLNELTFDDTGGAEELTLRGARDLQLGATNDIVIDAGRNLRAQANGTAAVDVGSVLDLSVGTDLAAAVGSSADLNIGTALTLATGTDLDMSAVQDLTFSAGNSFALTAAVAAVTIGSDLNLAAGRDLAFAAADDLSLGASDRLVLSGDLFINGVRYERFDSSAVYRAWANVAADGKIRAQRGIASVKREGRGIYAVTVSLPAISTDSLIPVVTAQLDGPPTSSAGMRFVAVDSISPSIFKVYIFGGSGSLEDGDFVLTVVGR